MATWKAVPLDDPHFWQKIDGGMGSGKGLFLDGGTRYVVMADNAVMVPILRTKEELFSSTVATMSRQRNLEVVINGMFYDLKFSGKQDAYFGNDPVPATATLPEGMLVENGMIVVNRPAPLMFHLVNHPNQCPAYTFGQGDPLTSSSTPGGIGGLGPMIIDGIKYGTGNQYRPGTTGPASGEPGTAWSGITQRNNNTFKAFAEKHPRTGKTIVAHVPGQDRILIIVHPHGGVGKSLPEIRDALFQNGARNAVFFDGSDSAMLMVDNHMYIKQAEDKDETNTVGIGFRYP